MSTTSRTISFRIGSDHYERLAATAAADNKSPGDFARLRLLESLDGDGGRGELVAYLDRLARAVADIRHDLPLTTRALLIAAGRQSPDTAERWARENLKTQD